MKKLFTIITLIFAFVSASLATILYPIKTPKADLLDIRFNVDGTATDVSGKKHKIVSSQPRPSVAVNDRYNLNAATFTGTGKDFYFFDYSADKKFIEEISGDFTMECLMRIDNFSKANTPFCSTDASGFGFDIGWFSRNNLSFLIHDGSKYVAVIDKSMAEGKYYHAVGVVRPNKAISFYVNGELIGTTPFTTLRLPSGNSQILYVGCDVNGNGDPEYAFKGEVVVARMYSKALTNEEVKSVYKAISSGNNSSSNNSSGNSGGSTTTTTSTTSTSTSVTNAPANLTAYRGKVGQRFTFLVKAKKDGKIWGGKNKIYTDESDLATASYHSDIQNAGNVDKVVVEIVADQGSYPSLTQNGITSNKYGKAKGAFKIIGVPTTEVTDPDMSKYRSKKNEMVKIRVTGRTSGTIYGKNTGNGYSDNSDLATAAVHAGFLKPGQTGTLFVRIKGPEDSHEAVLSNDVQSRKYGKSGGTFKIFRSRDTTPVNNPPSGNNNSSNNNSSNNSSGNNSSGNNSSGNNSSGNNSSGNNSSGNTSTTTSSSYLIPDGYYVIRYAESPDYVLTVTNYNVGKDVVVCEWEDKESQIWKVTNKKNGAVVIRAIKNEPRILDIAGNKLRNNTKAILSESERQWVPERQGNGTIVLMVKDNKNYCLDLMNGTANAKKNGIVEIWQTHKGVQEQWKFERVDNKKPVIAEGIYAIKSPMSTTPLALTLKDGKLAEGSELVTDNWKNANSQKWKVTHEKDGTIAIRSMMNANMVICLRSETITGTEQRLVMKKWNGDVLQRWKPKFFKYDNLTKANTYFLRFPMNWNMGIRVTTYQPHVNNFVDVGNVVGVSQDQWIFERVGDLPSSNNSGNTGSNNTGNTGSNNTGNTGSNNTGGNNTSTTSTSTTSVPSAPANLTSYRDKIGKRFTFLVKAKKDGKIWGGKNKIYTDESDLATASYHSDIQNAGNVDKVVVEIVADQGSYPSLTQNGITSNKYGKAKGAFKIIGVPTTEVTNTDMSKYRDKKNEMVKVRVTGRTSGIIYGKNSGNGYSDNSDLATAAVHAGFLKPGQTGTLFVRIKGPEDSHEAVLSNDVQSRKYGKSGGTFKIFRSRDTTPVNNPPSGNNNSSYNTSGNSGGSTTTTTSGTSTSTTSVPEAPANLTSYRDKIGKRFTFWVKAKKDGKIWGGKNNIYTDDSDLATASCHSGAQVAGNVDKVVVEIVADQGSYPSLTQNGITSNKYGAWKGAYKIIGVPTTKVTDPDMSKYRSKNGEMVIVRVTGRTSGTVYGQNSSYGYMDKSDLATAAVHAGLLKPGETGTLYVRIKSGSEKHEAVLKNGVQSRSYGKSEGTFKIRKCTDITSANGTNITGNTGNTGNSGNTSTSTSSSNLIPEDVYVIKSAGNKDYVITLKDGKATNRNQIVISKWQNTNAQKWKVTHEKNGTIVIRSMVNNKYAINVSEHQMNDHGQIISWLYENAQNEQWVPEKQSNGNFVLKVLENQNFALDIEGATYSDNVKVQLYGLHRGTNQQWIFQKAGTTSTGGNSGNDSSTTSVPNAPNHMLSYRGQNGKVYTFKVTGSTNGRIWGGDNNIYTDDSIIATAAVHAGLVKAGQTGTIKVKILPGQSSYSSIKRNGVTSYKNNGYGGSYQLSK